MQFNPIFPQSFDRKPRSNITRKDNSATTGWSLLRAQFSVSTWLLLGAALQSVVVLLHVFLHVRLSYIILPSLALLVIKGVNLFLEVFELKENPLRKGVIPGKHAAMIPSAGVGGGFARANGESVGGGSMVVFLLGARSNRLVTRSASFSYLPVPSLALLFFCVPKCKSRPRY